MTRMVSLLVPRSATLHLVEKVAFGAEKLHAQRHLADRVRRATQTGIEGADAGFEAIEDTLGNLWSLDRVAGDLQHSAIHRQVVLAGGDEQVHFLNETIGIHLVMVEQRAARRLAATNALQLVHTGVGA